MSLPIQTLPTSTRSRRLPRLHTPPAHRFGSGSSIVLLVGALATSLPAAAQDAHYATYQYGPRANLLGGAVVGSAVDVSATFYNPGALARLDSVALVATSQAFELTNLLFEPTDARESININDLGFDEAPGFFGGTLPFSFLGDAVLAYSVFTRYRFSGEIGDTQAPSFDAGGVQGEAFFKLRLSRSLSEQWFGLTYAAPTDSWGLGVSQFVAYRGQDGRNLGLAEVFPGREDGAISLVDEEFGYWHTRLLWKLGASFDWAGFSLGLTATTPSVGLFGSGRLESNKSVFGQDADGDATLDPTFVAGAQDGLSPSYKSPWAFGAGGTFRGAGTDFYVSAEYTDGLSEYTVLDGDDVIGQSTGDTLALELTTAVEPVLNFNLGIERQFSGRFTGFASFWTDFSSRREDRERDLAVSSWDILFVSAGSALTVGTADITFGLAYGWGSRAGAVFGEDVEDEIISRLPSTVDLAYRSLRLLIALSI